MILRPVAPPVEYGITKRLARAGNAAVALLRALGTSAHVWLPGANGVSVASLPSNNYLLSDGSTGYSTVDGVDGLDLDGMGALSSNIWTAGLVPTGWTSSNTTPVTNGSNLEFTSLANNSYSYKAFSTTSGLTYVLTVTATVATGVPHVIVSTSGVAGDLGYLTLPVGTSTLVFRATGASTVLGFDSTFNTGVLSVSAISCKPYTGTHLTQPTTANKPLVRRGMLNQITYSSDLTNATWLDYRSCTVSGQAIVEAAATASHFVQRATSVTIVSGIVYTAAYLVKANGRNFFAACNDAAFGFLGGVCRWDITTGTNTATGSGCTVSSASAGSGWYLLTITATATGVTARPAVGPCLDGTTTPISFQSYLGDGASGVLVAAVGVMSGTWTAAQILAEGGIPTTTATAASNPSAGKYWWSFDGSNDSMLSGNLGITNACTIVIAGRVNSMPAVSFTLVEEDTNGVSIFIQANGSLQFAKNGVAILTANVPGTIVAGVPFVITCRLSGGTATVRKIGVQVSTAATALTFSAITGARIGRNFADAIYGVNGALGWCVAIAKGLSDADCLTVERLVGSQFPGMATF